MGKTASITMIVGIVIALLLIGILLPIGLNDLVGYNGSYTVNGTIAGTNSTMATLVGTVIPVMAVISLVLMFVSRSK
ncbi:MAG: hypothetical protein ACP6IY_19315 [Promethearchaeia archaeon]